MSLTLEVTGSEAQRLGSAGRKVFTQTGGTIGRLPDNSWVLPDPHVSGRHATIRYANGSYLIIDLSANGTYLNTPESRLPKNQPHPLKHGDRLFIDIFEIRVAVTPEGAGKEAPIATETSPFVDQPARAPAPDPISDNPFADEPADSSHLTPLPRTPARPEVVAGLDPVTPTGTDPIMLLGLAARRPTPTPSMPRAEDLEAASPLSDSYRVMPPISKLALDGVETPPSKATIPADYDPLADEPSAAPVRTSPEARPPVGDPDNVGERPGIGELPRFSESAPHLAERPARRQLDESGEELSALLAGAGMAHAVVTPELAADFGRIMRIVVTGIMNLLRARQGIKQEFRMAGTVFIVGNNNPLKFSANVDDALHKLLVQRNPAYLPPVEAFEDALQDASHHQVAILAGLRVAFEHMLREFDPEILQERFDRQNKKGTLLGGRTKYWERYRDFYHDFAADPERTFRDLFGAEFARAYEAEMQRLKGLAHAKGPTA